MDFTWKEHFGTQVIVWETHLDHRVVVMDGAASHMPSPVARNSCNVKTTDNLGLPGQEVYYAGTTWTVEEPPTWRAKGFVARMHISEIAFMSEDSDVPRNYSIEISEYKDVLATGSTAPIDNPVVALRTPRALFSVYRQWYNNGRMGRYGTVAADFKKSMRVRYVPIHAAGDVRHSSCEDGVVSSKNDKWVFVKYDNLDCKMVTGDEPYTAKATPPENLIIIGV